MKDLLNFAVETVHLQNRLIAEETLLTTDLQNAACVAEGAKYDKLDIKIDEQQYAPPHMRYKAIDRLTYDDDPESSWHIEGVGPTKAEAVADLLEGLDNVTP